LSDESVLTELERLPVEVDHTFGLQDLPVTRQTVVSEYCQDPLLRCHLCKCGKVIRLAVPEPADIVPGVDYQVNFLPKAFGVGPKKIENSANALCTPVRKGQDSRRASGAVQLWNCLCLLHPQLCPDVCPDSVDEEGIGLSGVEL
jgi:hypothetical protein